MVLAETKNHGFCSKTNQRVMPIYLNLSLSYATCPLELYNQESVYKLTYFRCW